ncbi:hypothetical protein [Streptomyces hoynatensis]|nr:hypothetical protein [Streptomyces hoynatensis]
MPTPPPAPEPEPGTSVLERLRERVRAANAWSEANRKAKQGGTLR